MDSELAEAIQAALKCKRAASLRLVASSCRPATSGNVREGGFCRLESTATGRRRVAARVSARGGRRVLTTTGDCTACPLAVVPLPESPARTAHRESRTPPPPLGPKSPFLNGWVSIGATRPGASRSERDTCAPEACGSPGDGDGDRRPRAQLGMSWPSRPGAPTAASLGAT